jgi:hypothetical protein
VDGTGAFLDTTYHRQMAGSFVRELCHPDIPGVRRYWRGPDAIDTFLSGPAPRVVAEAIRYAVVPNAAKPTVVPTGLGTAAVFYPTSPTPLTDLKDQVFLTGYSRGAATMLDVAVLLKDYGIPVEAMFLFDSVTQSPWLRADRIPSNVKAFYHAKRSANSGSRTSWGNSTAQPDAGVVPDEKPFMTTHGGMGGVPWGEAGLLKPAPIDYLAPAGQPLWAPMAGYGPQFITPTQAAEAMVRRNPEKYADKIFEGAPHWAFTNVTVAQERLGMGAVRHWMWERLRKHGVVG